MDRFSTSEKQVNAILGIRLRQLAKLEEIKLREELTSLSLEKDTIGHILGSPVELNKLIREELESATKKYGNVRCSSLLEQDADKAFIKIDLITSESVSIVLSKMGWIPSSAPILCKPTNCHSRDRLTARLQACSIQKQGQIHQPRPWQPRTALFRCFRRRQGFYCSDEGYRIEKQERKSNTQGRQRYSTVANATHQ